MYERALLGLAQQAGHVGPLSGGRSVPEVAQAMAAGLKDALTRMIDEAAAEGETEIGVDVVNRVLAQVAAERGLPPPRPPPGAQPPPQQQPPGQGP